MRPLLLATSLLIVALVVGCSPLKRHEVASIFIDGMPPYVSPEERARLEEEELAGLSAELASTRERKGIQRKPLKSFHGPYAAKECWRCHRMDMSPGGGRGAKVSRASRSGWLSDVSGNKHLRKPVTELCLECHDEFYEDNPVNEGMWLHGPVATGGCVMCHDPHASPYARLILDDPISNVCVACHDTEDLLTFTPEHRREVPRELPVAVDLDAGEAAQKLEVQGEVQGSVEVAPNLQLVQDCTRCHDPHSGVDHRLLRADYINVTTARSSRAGVGTQSSARDRF